MHIELLAYSVGLCEISQFVILENVSIFGLALSGVKGLRDSPPDFGEPHEAIYVL